MVRRVDVRHGALGLDRPLSLSEAANPKPGSDLYCCVNDIRLQCSR